MIATVASGELKLQVRDQRKHQVEARRLAVEYARDKAVHLAELNQMKLGAAVSITEDVEYNGDATGFGTPARAAADPDWPRQRLSATVAG